MSQEIAQNPITPETCFVPQTNRGKGRRTAVAPGTTAARYLHYGRITLSAGDAPEKFNSNDHGLRVKNNAMRGGLLENFYFRNINVGQVAQAVITVDFNYEEGAKGSFTPVVRNFWVDRLVSSKSKHALDVQGLAGAPIYNLNLSNCIFENVAEPSIVKNLQNATVHNVKINGKEITSLP